MGVVFCQVEVSVTDRSFVQRSPTKCVCVWCVWCVCVCGVCGVCVCSVCVCACLCDTTADQFVILSASPFK